MQTYDLITKVKRKQELSKEEIREFIFGYTRGEIPDYQVSSLLMAIYFNGLTKEETAALTEAIADSGCRMDLSAFGELSVDKHSTGGVGDKTTLIVAPLTASLGCKVAKMSGRGLGHTGGTVDKLESFPGFKTTLSPEDFISKVDKYGIAVIGQSEGLAPADKKLYALRDVTATVDSIPLITSSIMGKKLASGTKNIILDVKYGSGAFMKTPEEAEMLAQSMVDIGKMCGRNTAALITDMDTPLGYAVGNVLEIIEAVEVLRGDGPDDLREISLSLASELFALAKKIDRETAKKEAESALYSGKAYEKFVEWITLQGGKSEHAKDPKQLFYPKYSLPVYSKEEGYVISTDAEKIGLSSLVLGAGRQTKEDSVDMQAGIIINKKRGDKVCVGELLATLYTNDEKKLSEAKRIFEEAYLFAKESPKSAPLIYKTIL